MSGLHRAPRELGGCSHFCSRAWGFSLDSPLSCTGVLIAFSFCHPRSLTFLSLSRASLGRDGGLAAQGRGGRGRPLLALGAHPHTHSAGRGRGQAGASRRLWLWEVTDPRRPSLEGGAWVSGVHFASCYNCRSAQGLEHILERERAGEWGCRRLAQIPPSQGFAVRPPGLSFAPPPPLLLSSPCLPLFLLPPFPSLSPSPCFPSFSPQSCTFTDNKEQLKEAPDPPKVTWTVGAGARGQP